MRGWEGLLRQLDVTRHDTEPSVRRERYGRKKREERREKRERKALLYYEVVVRSSRDRAVRQNTHTHNRQHITLTRGAVRHSKQEKRSDNAGSRNQVRSKCSF